MLMWLMLMGLLMGMMMGTMRPDEDGDGDDVEA